MSYNYNELVEEINQSRKAVKNASSDDDRMQNLEASLGHFETLSKHCPMAPLLWMQYAYDASTLANMALEQEYGASFHPDALEMGLQILELGSQQFPGCAVLYLLQVQWSAELWALKKETLSKEEQKDAIDAYMRKIEQALTAVGEGSHRTEGPIIREIYQQRAEAMIPFVEIQVEEQIVEPKDSLQQISEQVLKAFELRAEYPMNLDLNCAIQDDYEQFIQRHSTDPLPLLALPEASQKLEMARRREASVFSHLQTYEDDITIAMQQEHILAPLLSSTDGWAHVQKMLLESPSDNNTSWMGMGGIQTAQAFIQYAQVCSRYKNKDDEEAQKIIRSLVYKIYERGVSECPTVETLWLSYLKQLYYQMRQLRQQDNSSQYHALLQQAKAVADRAIRNCPYSVKMVQERLNIILLQANVAQTTLDPEALYKTTILQETIGNKFITTPQQILQLFLTTTQVVRRHILAFLANMAPKLKEDANNKPKKKSKQAPAIYYDDPESIATPTFSKDDLDDEKMQELEDLCTDLREIYDDMDEYLRKNHQKFKEGRAKMWKDRGWTETHLVGPIMTCFDEEIASAKVDTSRYAEVTKALDKATKVSLPVHPSVFVEYNQAVLTCYPVLKTPFHVMMKMRQVRFLYHTALKSVGKPKDKGNEAAVAATGSQELDYETALRCLCQDYLEFEQYFGSEFSYADASKSVQKKLSRAFANGVQHQSYTAALEDNDTAKRKHSIVDDDAMDDRDHTEELSTKKQKVDHVTSDQPKTTLSIPKPVKHKVKVGNIEYPAHPYTIRVSFLSTKTEDMDLVDIFRPKCGAVVHAKIMRDKHHSPHEKGKSKGWGLVQFEEKESVEKALALSDVIGIDEKSVKIERSHLPAVGLVPPGMHRVNPKGQGKSTKRNQKRKESLQVESSNTKDDGDAKPPVTAAVSTKASGLSFRPRVVIKNAKRKPKISVPKAGEK